MRGGNVPRTRYLRALVRWSLPRGRCNVDCGKSRDQEPCSEGFIFITIKVSVLGFQMIRVPLGHCTDRLLMGRISQTFEWKRQGPPHATKRRTGKLAAFRW